MTASQGTSSYEPLQMLGSSARLCFIGGDSGAAHRWGQAQVLIDVARQVGRQASEEGASSMDTHVPESAEDRWPVCRPL